MQQKYVHTFQPRPFKAGREAVRQRFLDFGGVCRPKPAFRSDPDATWQSAIECSAYDIFRLSHAVGWCQVEQGNSRINCGVHGGDAFIPICFPPELTDAAAAKG